MESSPEDVSNTERLYRHWTTGPGGLKIVWNTPGDYTRCVALLGRYVPDQMVRGMCAKMHHRTTGRWPGDKDNK